MWCGKLRHTTTHFGYKACEDCRESSVHTAADLNRLRDATVPFLQDHLGAVRYGEIPVRFGVVPAPEFGILNPLGLAIYGPADNHILIQEGLPFDYAAGVLAHEFGHMIINLEPDSLHMRPRATMNDRLFEEGFCEVLCALKLLSSSHDAARFQSFMMPGNPDPIYGEGFRIMWARLEELGSVAALLETLTLQKHHFEKPFTDVMFDEFDVPDDISPLVELTSGDRDKGPLRGTAILTRELPIDAPRGPRLRGRGLGVLDSPSRVSPSPATKGTLRGSGMASNPLDASTQNEKKKSLRGKGLDKKS